MAARSTAVVFHNETDFILIKIEEDLPHGQWTDPWQPPQTIPSRSTSEWRSESDGIATGTQGSIRLSAQNGNGLSVYFHWDNPFDGTNSYHQFTDAEFEVFHTGGDGNDARVDVFLRASVSHFVPGAQHAVGGAMSPTSGHAMRPSDRSAAFGAVIRRAFDGLKEGRSQLPILMWLQ
jgi:hypothetical protein